MKAAARLVMKRPSASVSGEEVMRKPAGIDPMVKTELFSDFVDKMHLKPSAKRPATDDEDDCDGNPSKYAELNEWKRKKRFFDANQDKFEPWANDMYNDAKNKPSGSRAAVRHIVEQAIEKTNDGKLKPSIQNPLFEEYAATYNDRYGETTATGLTHTCHDNGPEHQDDEESQIPEP